MPVRPTHALPSRYVESLTHTNKAYFFSLFFDLQVLVGLLLDDVYTIDFHAGVTFTIHLRLC